MSNWMIVAGASLAVILWFLERKGVLRLLTLVAAVLGILVVSVAFFVFQEPSSLGPEDWFDQSPVREMIFFLTMAIGMTAYTLTVAIEKRRAQLAEWRSGGQKGAKPGIELDAWEFSYPFLFSTMTFGGLLAQIGDVGVEVSTIVIAFQTGFFWQTVFDKLKGRMTQTP
jgi:drug/metabolite transporter (DMT)-like permease